MPWQENRPKTSEYQDNNLTNRATQPGLKIFLFKISAKGHTPPFTSYSKKRFLRSGGIHQPLASPVLQAWSIGIQAKSSCAALRLLRGETDFHGAWLPSRVPHCNKELQFLPFHPDSCLMTRYSLRQDSPCGISQATPLGSCCWWPLVQSLTF